MKATMGVRRGAGHPRRTSCIPHLSRDVSVPLKPEKFHDRETTAKGAPPVARFLRVSVGRLRASGEPDGGALLFSARARFRHGNPGAGGDGR